MNFIESRSIPEPNSGCWIWLLAVDRDGYGICTMPRGNGPRMRKAHRLSYELEVGPIAAGLKVLHRCDNPSCVNPEHLYCGTARENIHDAFHRYRARPQGKVPLSPENVEAISLSTERSGTLAKKYGVHRHTIHNIRSKRTWQGTLRP